MLIPGKISFGVRRIASPPLIRIKIASTIKVYGLRKARLTIHIVCLPSLGDFARLGSAPLIPAPTNYHQGNWFSTRGKSDSYPLERAVLSGPFCSALVFRRSRITFTSSTPHNPSQLSGATIRRLHRFKEFPPRNRPESFGRARLPPSRILNGTVTPTLFESA